MIVPAARGVHGAEMETVKFDAAPIYTAPGHDDVVARRLQGAPASSAAFATVGHSHVPDGAVIPMDRGAVDKIYIVTEGSLSILQEDGMRHVLHVGDSIFIPTGEGRAVVNDSGRAASMVVVTPGAGAAAPSTTAS